MVWFILFGKYIKIIFALLTLVCINKGIGDSRKRGIENTDVYNKGPLSDLQAIFELHDFFHQKTSPSSYITLRFSPTKGLWSKCPYRNFSAVS